MKYDHIAWDFNGTILDDVSASTGATDILLERRGKPHIPSLAFYYREFCFPIVEYYEKIGFDFSKESYADVANEWTVEYRRLSATCPLREGVLPLMQALYAKRIPQTVLSASEEGLLREQLAHLGVLSYLENAYGLGNSLGNDKSSVVSGFATLRRPGRVLFIGDTDHDAAVARQAGFDVVLMAGGHQSKERLLALGAPVFEDFASLIAYLKRQGNL